MERWGAGKLHCRSELSLNSKQIPNSSITYLYQLWNDGVFWYILITSFVSLLPSAEDLIRTTVGQTRLLIAERFKQFEGLVDNCEFKRGEKETTCTDLDGFWDMINFQVCTCMFTNYSKYTWWRYLQAMDWNFYSLKYSDSDIFSLLEICPCLIFCNSE